jgi:predicted Zn-dependent peptidase
MQDVKEFFYKYYLPNNAIMVVAGNIRLSEAKRLTEKYFGSIPPGKKYERKLPTEPKQIRKKTLIHSTNVPQNAIYKVFHMPEKLHKDYAPLDLLSDMLGRGKSSHLYQSLVKEQKLFNSINCYVLGSNEPGLFVVEGKLNNEIGFEQAEKAIDNEINKAVTTLQESTLEKVKNQYETALVLEEIDLLRRAMYLAFGANLGNANLINEEKATIQRVKSDDIQYVYREYIKEENSSVLYYQKI